MVCYYSRYVVCYWRSSTNGTRYLCPGRSQKKPANTTTIDEDKTFEKDLVINAGDELVIKPGITLKFTPDAGIICYGVMNAVGTKEKPITFTAKEQEKGWKNISLVGKDTDSSVFTWCHISYGKGRHAQFKSPSLELDKFVTPKEQGDLIIVCGGALFIYAASNIKITDCYFEKNNAYYGGAICCWGKATPTITKNYFSGNSAGEDGGAIHCVLFSSPTISDNYISDNSTMYGGAIHCLHHSSPTISGNYITNNTASRNAGAISCFNNCAPVIKGNYISGNSAGKGEGGAICTVVNSKLVIKENYIDENKSKSGTGKGLEANKEFKGKKDESTCTEETTASKDTILEALKKNGILDLSTNFKK